MFSKFALLSKEFSFFGILTLLSGLTIADFQWLLNLLPETISLATAATLTFIFSVSGLILRYFFTDGKLTFFKKNVTSAKEKAAMEEVAEIVKESPENVTSILEAAADLKRKKALAEARRLIAEEDAKTAAAA